MSKVIVFADARSRINLKEKSTIGRHVEYILELRKLEGFEKAKLLVLQPSLSFFKSEEIDLENIRIVRLSISRLLNLKNYVSSNDQQISLIVSGDPWESYLFSSIIKALINEKCPIQVQVHAELSNAWSAQRLLNKFRTYSAGIALRKAFNVRAVSIEQREFLIKKYRLDKRKVIVIPVQINNAEALATGKSRIRPSTIGFIGRLHKERNIQLFVEIVEYLMSKDKDLRLVIATTGKMDGYEGRRFSRIPAERITRFENLSPGKLPIFWEKVGVLLSTSESESFGRSIREAIVNGIPVMAQTSMGTRELKRECNDSVELFDSNGSFDALLETYKSLHERMVPDEYKDLIKSKNERIPSDIAESWKRTAEMFHIR